MKLGLTNTKLGVSTSITSNKHHLYLFCGELRKSNRLAVWIYYNTAITRCLAALLDIVRTAEASASFPLSNSL